MKSNRATKQFESWFRQNSIPFKRLGVPDQEGAAWTFSLAEVDCILSWELNTEDIGIPTVTIVAKIGEAHRTDSALIGALLTESSELVNASFAVHEDGDLLNVQVTRRLRLESFAAKRLSDEVHDLLEQVDHQIPYIEEATSRWARSLEGTERGPSARDYAEWAITIGKGLKFVASFL